jgi:hypothetical protein
VATSLGTLLLTPRCLILKNQCHYCLMHVWPYTNYVEVQAVVMGAWVGKGCIHQIRYMCWGDNSWPCNNEGYHFCPCWCCVSWATWHKATHLSFLQKDTTTPNCSQGTCNPVNTVLPKNWFGSFVLSSIRSSFFFRQGENLKVPIYEQRKAGILITCLEDGFLP